MQLSGGEKLILVMLSEIYEKLGIKGEIEPVLVKAAILSNQPWSLNWKYGGLLGEEDDTPPDVRETADILNMWMVIEAACAKFTDAEKAAVKEAAGPFAEAGRFEGFDGNNDAHYGIAEFLITDMGRFENFKDRNLNSHSITSLSGYRKMLSVYNPIVRSLHGRPLTADEVIQIFKGRQNS
ncbi:MAG TPA: YfbU family protein [Terriglobia bacterium]|nr:YfbU family protein [Terriglobia bacterium]